MARSTRLSDLQLVLLAHAGKRDDGAILPLPENTVDDARCRRELTKLLDRNLIAAIAIGGAAGEEALEEAAADGAGRDPVAAAFAGLARGIAGARTTLTLTDAGRDAIGIGTDAAELRANEPGAPGGAAEPAGGATPGLAPVTSTPRAGSKAALIHDLLRRPEGAALAELATATGWLPHTTRAALTRLRQKGLNIALDRSNGGSRYRIVEAN